MGSVQPASKCKSNRASDYRRGILSTVYSLFDPLGFIAPYTIKKKLLLQMLSRKKIGWDETLAENKRDQWRKWLEDVEKLEGVKIDRCFTSQ